MIFGVDSGPYHTPGLLSVLATIRRAADRGAVICEELGDHDAADWFASISEAAEAREHARRAAG